MLSILQNPKKGRVHPLGPRERRLTCLCATKEQNLQREVRTKKNQTTNQEPYRRRAIQM